MYETMLHLGLHENLNTDLWPECAATMTKIEKNMVNPHEENVPLRISTARYQTTQNTYRLWEKWEFYVVLST